MAEHEQSESSKVRGPTPGPWTWLGGLEEIAHDPEEGFTQKYGGLELKDAEGKTLLGWRVDHFVAYWEDVPSEANARLIAAAPALLEALEKMIAYATAYQGRFPGNVRLKDVTAARSALAQARGEKP